ncbi:MAG: B12-binding domain-containing radical SAM protein [Myxococcales bacterium]|nr:B12-binding domain-containing radical SAM protein [Myxococcales bacterium]
MQVQRAFEARTLAAPLTSFRDIRAQRLADEIGTITKQASLPVALVYPSPYHVGMSSLGFQTIYRELNALPEISAERAFLPEDVPAAKQAREPLCTYESARPVGDFPVVAFSLAYELELAGLVDCLDLAGIPPLARDRADDPHRHPLVVVGGPLTFSNPVPAGPFADLMIMGEAEDLVGVLMQTVLDTSDRGALLQTLAKVPGFYVPSVHGELPPPVAKVPDERLPAHSQIRTPHTELADMFLIEPERGCHRGCTYCVMRRSTNGGMRLVTPEKVLSLIPEDAKRVGLVGAAVTDHPGLPKILSALVAQGRGVGISSLRADRLTDEIVGLLKAGGYRTLTTASDGASERMRDAIARKTHARHLLRAAALTRKHGLRLLKLYMMLGLPGETMDDVDELVGFAKELAREAPKVAFGIAPFVAKRNTPLDRHPFEDMASIEAKLARLRAGVKGQVDIRSTSVRWAWVEYRLAQGGFAAGHAAMEAARGGGSFGHWKRALAHVPEPEALRPEPLPSLRVLPASLAPGEGRSSTLVPD